MSTTNKITAREFEFLMSEHIKWLDDRSTGKRADFTDANLEEDYPQTIMIPITVLFNIEDMEHDYSIWREYIFNKRVLHRNGGVKVDYFTDKGIEYVRLISLKYKNLMK